MDEITGTEDIINYPDVKERLAELKPWHVDDYRDAPSFPVSHPAFPTEAEALQYIAGQPEGDRGHLEAWEDTDESEEREALLGLAESFEGVSSYSGAGDS